MTQLEGPFSTHSSSEENSGLARRHLTDAAMSQIPFWDPGVPPWKPFKERNSSLRIAAIVSDRLYDGLRFEGELLLLTPNNADATLKRAKPDMLLVESTWETVTGHWGLAQSAPGAAAEELREVIRSARALQIPTVFWFTEDSVYHDHYRDFCACFDHVFCADPLETQSLQAEGVDAQDLLPCVQPALYNPFRKHEEYDSLELGVLFDGWADLDRCPDAFDVLHEVAEDHQLSIVESRYLLTKNRLHEAGPHSDRILGCATRESRVLALKYAKATITFDNTLSTRTTQRWEALQATASYCPMIHFGTISDNDIRHGLVQGFADDLDALVELLRIEEDDLYRQRIAHRVWRDTLLHHTFSHRLRQICEAVRIPFDWDEYPKVSVITPTCRPKMAAHAVETYRRQTYPNREMLLVYNGGSLNELPDVELHTDVRVLQVPRDRFAGAALNLGFEFASGVCCFRMDDDDDYAEHYLLDLMLHRRAVEAPVFGKPPTPIRFEGESKIYRSSRGGLRPYSIFTGEMLREGVVWLGGNTISIVRNSGFSYRSDSVAAADTFFNLDLPRDTLILAADGFNVVANRRKNAESHTWRDLSKKSIVARAETLYECDIEI